MLKAITLSAWLVACATLADATFAAEAADDKWTSYHASEKPPAEPLPAEKETLIKHGVTLGKLVEILGPGWMPIHPPESNGIITYFFNDGRKLYVWPKTYRSTEPVYFGQNLVGGRMWWQPARND